MIFGYVIERNIISIFFFRFKAAITENLESVNNELEKQRRRILSNSSNQNNDAVDDAFEVYSERVIQCFEKCEDSVSFRKLFRFHIVR